MTASPSAADSRSGRLLGQRNALSAALARATNRQDVLTALEQAVAGLPGVDGGFVLVRAGRALTSVLGLGAHRHADIAGVEEHPESSDDGTAAADADGPRGGRVRLRDGRTVDVVLSPMTGEGGEHVLALSRRANGPPPARVEVETAAALVAEGWAVLRRLEIADAITAITHDLQAPLTGLLGFTSTLRHLGGELGEEERIAYLETMERQIRRVAGLVDDMLVAARLEAGDLRPDEPEQVNLAELAEDVVSLFGPEQRRRVTVRAHAPVHVHADRRQLERALQNLVDNALKYAPPPSPVVVEVARMDGRGVATVTDSGPGIPVEARAELFTRFGRLGPSRPGSTGLGLFIVRGIVDAHGGEVTVDSTPGHGTTFTLALPLAAREGTRPTG